MFEVVGGLIVAVLSGRLAEEHGLFVEEDVSPSRTYPQPKVAFVL